MHVGRLTATLANIPASADANLALQSALTSDFNRCVNTGLTQATKQTLLYLLALLAIIPAIGAGLGLYSKARGGSFAEGFMIPFALLLACCSRSSNVTVRSAYEPTHYATPPSTPRGDTPIALTLEEPSQEKIIGDIHRLFAAENNQLPGTFAINMSSLTS